MELEEKVGAARAIVHEAAGIFADTRDAAVREAAVKTMEAAAELMHVLEAKQ